MKKFLAILVTAILAITACVSLIGCNNPTTYKDLQIVEVGGETESFGIAFRKGSNLTRKVETAISELLAEGKLAELATKYGVAGVSEYTPVADENETSTDWASISAKGKLVVGITDYKPMDYKETGSEEWIGFDADLAKLVGEKLNITIEFSEIEWDNKILDLQAGRIDCIWNGMTITDEIIASADVSKPYMENRQVGVILKKNAEKYPDLASMAGVKIAAEAGSAGETFIKANDAIKGGFVSVTAQSDAFLEVMSGKSEVAIVDYMMAKALIEG
ncbi:MAG: transporter substrate-binding domain-containing protein [Clostridia bacterium]|nr:transporter substrate-binding domain-containing protein [Clostridia bacterium]